MVKPICSWICEQEGYQSTSLCPDSSLVELNFILNAQDSLEMDCEHLSHFIYKWKSSGHKQIHYLTTQESISSNIPSGKLCCLPYSCLYFLYLLQYFVAVLSGDHVAIP